MLYQVLQLTPDQINALPPAERDAIQQLVGSRFPAIHVSSSVWNADSYFVPALFPCSFVPALPRFEEESVHGWRHHRLTCHLPSRALQLPWLAVAGGFRVCDSLLAMPRRYHALCRSFCGSPTAFLIFSPFVASFLSHDIQRTHVQPCPDGDHTTSGVVAVL